MPADRRYVPRHSQATPGQSGQPPGGYRPGAKPETSFGVRRQSPLELWLARLRDLAAVVEDRRVGKQLTEVVLAMIALYDIHDIDDSGRCDVCRPKGRMRRRHRCSVHDALTSHRIAGPMDGTDR
jgi:hypothetical protein